MTCPTRWSCVRVRSSSTRAASWPTDRRPSSSRTTSCWAATASSCRGASRCTRTRIATAPPCTSPPTATRRAPRPSTTTDAAVRSRAVRTGVRFGLVTPVLTLLPRAHARWEEEAGIAEVERIVVEADRLGYDHVTCSEHVAVPVDVAGVRGGRYWDPLATFGYLAAKTTRIRFATYVLVVGYHHPLAIAKRYGTLDQVTNGRLILGVGVGSLQQEFELLGADFEHRGARGDDALRALRSSFGRLRPEYHGEFYDYEGVLVDP